MASSTKKIARLLNVSPGQAKAFAKAVQSRKQRPKNWSWIVRALEALEPEARTVDNVAFMISQHSLGEMRALADQKGWLGILTKRVQERLPYPVTENVVLAAVQALQGQHDLDRIVAYLDRFTPLVRLSDRLGGDVKEAAAFVERLEDHVGSAVDLNSVLEVFERVDGVEPSVTAVAEWLELFAIARQLKIDPLSVPRLLKRIEQVTNTSVEPEQVREALAQLEGEPEPLGSLVRLIRLGKELDLGQVEVRDYMAQVADELEDKITDKELLRAVLAVGDRRHQTDEVAWQIRIHRFQETVGEMEPKQARAMLEEIDRHLPSRARSVEIDRALVFASDEGMRIEEIAQHITVARIAVLLARPEGEAKRLLRSVQNNVGGTVTPGEVLEALTCGPADEDEIVGLIDIARLLAIAFSEAEDLYQRIQARLSGPASRMEIAWALDDLPTNERTVEVAVACMGIERILGQLDGLRERPTTLRAALSTRGQREITYRELQKRLNGAELWQGIDSAERSVRDILLDALTTACLIESDLATLYEIGERARQKSGRPLDPALLLATMRGAAPQNRRLPRAAELVVLTQVVRPEDNTLPELNRFVGKLHRHGNSQNTFWRQLSRVDKQGELSPADLEQLLDVINWPPPAFRFLEPEDGIQRWITKAEIEQIVERLNKWASASLSRLARVLGLRDSERERELERYGERCWREINAGKRRYQVPSRGRAIIETEQRLRGLLELTAIRFIAEGASPPALYAQLQFGERIGAVSISADEQVKGVHRLAEDHLWQALISAVTLSYYRDLVLSGEVTVSQPATRVKPSQSNRRRRPKRAIPNPQRKPRSGRTVRYHLSEWYDAQERARHYVRGHVRQCADPNFLASLEKRAQAKAAGVILQRGETWVVEHERGNPQFGRIKLDGFDLINRCVFRAPVRATQELEAILF